MVIPVNVRSGRIVLLWVSPLSSPGLPNDDSVVKSHRLSSTACVVTQYFASMLAFSHLGREAGSFR